jgi:hypothetical protein
MTISDKIHWRELLLNPEAVASVFGENDPDLGAVRLQALGIAECGSAINIKLAVECAPLNQPLRWPRTNANATSIELQCLDLRELSLTMRSGESAVSCKLGTDERHSSRTVEIHGSSTDLLIRCGFLKVNRITPYSYDPSISAL